MYCYIYYFQKQIALTKEQLNQFERLCECRLARMPIQYILGEWDFLDLTLKMVPPVFIPRSETEELVQLILQQCDDKMTMRFLEIGVGSGAISLAMLHSLPKVRRLNFISTHSFHINCLSEHRLRRLRSIRVNMRAN